MKYPHEGNPVEYLDSVPQAGEKINKGWETGKSHVAFQGILTVPEGVFKGSVCQAEMDEHFEDTKVKSF